MSDDEPELWEDDNPPKGLNLKWAVLFAVIMWVVIFAVGYFIVRGI